MWSYQQSTDDDDDVDHDDDDEQYINLDTCVVPWAKTLPGDRWFAVAVPSTWRMWLASLHYAL